MKWLLDLFLKNKLQFETERYLRELAHAPISAARRNASDLLAKLRAVPGPKITLGETLWGESVEAPLEEIVKACGLITGGMGSGKSMFGLGILESLIDLVPETRTMGCGILDAKGDLYHGAFYLLMHRLEYLTRHDPEAARDFRRRVVIYDFASRDPASSYNILARWPNAEPDFFASNRADLLLDLLPGGEKLSLGASALLQKSILLLSEFNLPITYVNELLHDEALRRRLLARAKNHSVATSFMRQLSEAPKATVAALSRRIDALFASEGVRLALSGDTVPDFRRFQDEGRLVLLNCFGENISRSVRRLLQALVLSDIRQAVFARRQKDTSCLWLCDEAQNFFLTEKERDNMTDLLTMSRSFGSYFVFLTQNVSTAVQDPRMLKILYTNIRWSLSMRGEPGDCAFLKAALPVTGRTLRPQASPFQEKEFYSIPEERAMALDAIAHLPDRVGILWFKARSAEAVKIKTKELTIPQGRDLEEATERLRRDPTIGMRTSQKEYKRRIAERDREWMVEQEGDVGAKLAQAYQRNRSTERTE
jgi:hypothetical protein